MPLLAGGGSPASRSPRRPAPPPPASPDLIRLPPCAVACATRAKPALGLARARGLPTVALAFQIHSCDHLPVAPTLAHSFLKPRCRSAGSKQPSLDVYVACRSGRTFSPW